MLTTGADTLSGTAGNDTFLAADTTGSTWTVGDNLNGGQGTDTLKVVTANNVSLPVGAKLTSVEVVDILSSGTVDVDFSSFTDVATIKTTGTTTTLVGSGTQTIDATASNSAMTIDGGSNVTVTSKANVSKAIAVGGTTAATGDVSVTSTGGTANTDANGAITVTGGKTISVTQNAGNKATTGVDTTGGAITVTGDANTTKVTVTQTANNAGLTATATAAGAVGFTAGLVKVSDKNSASNTAAGTISEVTLSSWYGTNADAANTSTVNSGALTTLNLSGNGNNLNVTAGALTTAVVDTLALNVNGLTTKAIKAGGTGLVTVDTDYKTINLNGSTAASTIADLSIAGATALNVSGDAAVTLTASTVTALKTVTVTNTAGFKMDDINATTTFTGGAGADAVTLANAMETVVDMGAGDDKVTYGGATSTTAGKVGSVKGGDGTDTIAMTAAQANSTDGASSSAAFNTAFSGFEVLDVTATNANVAINLAGINGVNSVVARGIASGNTLTLDGFANNGTLTLDSDAASATLSAYVANVTNAVLNANDTFNIVLKNGTAGVLDAGSITVAGVETVNITTTDAGKGADAAATIDTAVLVATAAKSVVVTGNNGLTLTNTGNNKITSFDATGVVADSDATIDTAANLAVTFASVNDTTTASVTIKGGAGNDVLSGGAAKDTITGGAGADTVSGGLGQDTINTGNGRDVIKVASNSDANVATSDSTTAAADVINGFVLASAITTATNLSSAANFIASKQGGSNTSLLSIDLTGDDAAAGTGTNLAVTIEANATGNGQAAGVTYEVKNGLLTLGGTGASGIDTLAEWLTEAAAVASTNGETLAFVFGSDTYVYAQNGAQDLLMQVAGVAATSLVLVGAATTADAGAILIGDNL